MEEGLWVILLEAAVALCLLLGIVWATWPKGKPADHRASRPDAGNQPTGEQEQK